MNTQAHALPETHTFLPRMRVNDVVAEYWLCQGMLRLRREVCWLWYERGQLAGNPVSQETAVLPPFSDRLSSVLDLTRYERDKRAFFATDVTARYLSDLLEQAEPSHDGTQTGSFSWLVRELALSPVECFALALALIPVVDSAAGAVFSACLNDPSATTPTLALVQRLWDVPEEVLPLVGTDHPLARYGLLYPGPASWDSPLAINTAIACRLLGLEQATAGTLRVVEEDDQAREADAAQIEQFTGRLSRFDPHRLRLIPLLGPRGVPLAEAAASLAAGAGRALLAPQAYAQVVDLPALMTLSWLRGAVLYVPVELVAGASNNDEHAAPVVMPLPGLPLTMVIGINHRSELKRLPTVLLSPVFTLPHLDYHGRLATWRRNLPLDDAPALRETLADCARRFRYQRVEIENICAELRALDRELTPGDIVTACRSDIDLGELAQPVEPRFTLDELMLPPTQAAHVGEVIRAMRNVARVHYEWGTGEAWSESGLSALFCGAPGTGKTMAAEVIAAELNMPMYRIDLSQVVNKYIGETEKNLRRLFDAADTSDVILFFDEADALFGKRTEVKDAHDRYANLEVSYLLERMERFKGLAILATNRRKDLDEAFLRRLRFVIEFPLPDVGERRRIWQNVIPAGVDASALDLAFLAEHFPLSGGHIRSIALHACLQSGGEGMPRRLEMQVVLHALRHEYDKLDRVVSLEQFGQYAGLVEERS